VILRLADLRYIRVNRGFLEMTGHVEADVVGRSIHELDVLEGAKRREVALARLREHGTISQMEAWPRRAGGEPMLVLLAGQPIEVGNTPCILFTFADLEPRRRAEMSLYESEQRFERAFRLAPVPMAVAALDDWFRFILVNDAFEEATGHRAADAVGRTAKELGLWVDPNAAAELERALRDQYRVRGVDVRLKARDGLVLDCVLSAEAVTIDGRSCALWVLHDVTERRRTEAELAAAIDAVMRDTSWFSQSVLEKLARLRTPARSDNVAGSVAELTRRGREVLGLVSQGLDDVGIAERLGLSRTTVRNHVNDLYRRTGTHGRAALVVWARERGFARAEGSGAKRPRHPRR
jgi:PAS domain S-box-containing protein